MPQFPFRSTNRMKISRTATRTNHPAKLVNHGAHAHLSQSGSLQASSSNKLCPRAFLVSIRFFCKSLLALSPLQYTVILGILAISCAHHSLYAPCRGAQGVGAGAVASISCHRALTEAHSAALKTVNLCCHTALLLLAVFFFNFFFCQQN